MSAEAVAVAERMMEAVKAMNPEEFLACLHSDVVFSEADSLPYGGEHKGIDGILKLFTTVVEQFDFAIEDYSLADAGEFVVNRATATFTARSTGRSLTTDVIELYWVTDGLISRGDIFYKDTLAMVALLDA